MTTTSHDADLSFNELRAITLRNMQRPITMPGAEFFMKLVDIDDSIAVAIRQTKVSHAEVACAMADIVIVADRLCADAGIDLPAAIRERFGPAEEGGLPDADLDYEPGKRPLVHPPAMHPVPRLPPVVHDHRLPRPAPVVHEHKLPQKETKP